MPPPKKIYWGVATPKGEPNSKSTYYFQECQTKQIAQEIVGLPVKISHNHTLKDGTLSPPAGIVVHGAVHPKTGDVWAGFVMHDGPTGELAGTLLGEDDALPPELRMGELSLGFDIITDLPTGKPRGHTLKELSICYSGARPGCQIKASCPFPLPTQGQPPQEYNPKSVSESINKYINVLNREKEGEMNKLSEPPKEKHIPRPSDARGAEDFFNNVPIPQTGVIAAKASSSTAMEVDAPSAGAADPPQKDAGSIVQDFLQSRKRPAAAEESQEDVQKRQQRERIRLDFTKFIDAANSEWKEPAMPEGLTEAQQQAFRDLYAGQKALWEKNQQMERENRRKYLNRLQGATDNFIPTFVEQAAQEGKEVNRNALETLMGSMADIHPEMSNAFLQFIEAQAKQGQKVVDLQKDINHLEKEYQDKLTKLAQENAELKKNQVRPPLAAPPQQPVATPLARSVQHGVIPQNPLEGLGEFGKIMAVASFQTNAQVPPGRKNQLPYELIMENSRIFDQQWKKAQSGAF